MISPLFDRVARTGLAVLVLTLLLGVSDLRAQAVGTVSGRVVNEASLRPLNAAQVYLVGNQIGSLTNQEGRFLLLNVPAGEHQLRVELIGMQAAARTVTVQAGATVNVEVTMREVALALDEIVVTGTAGGVRAREVGNAISVVSRAVEIDAPVSVETMLQAQAPGMTVLLNSGQIGGGAQIRLRGNVSASMSNQPIIYIDGVRVRSEPYPNPTRVGFRSNNENHSPLNDLNPADIERVEIIKGAAAATLYGTEAAAGVIQIFTKTGRAGRPIWSIQVDQGFNQLMRFAPDPVPFFRLDQWLKKGWQQQYNLGVSGGAESLRYFMSGALEDRKGVLPDESLDRKALRGNFSFTPLAGLDLTWSNFISNSDISNVSGGTNPSAFIFNVMRWETNHIGSQDPVQLARLFDQEFFSHIDRLNSGVTATYVPVSNWSHRLAVGYDLGSTSDKRLRPYGFIWQPWDLMVRNFRGETVTADYSSTLELNIASGLTTSFSAGGQFVSTKEETIEGYSTNFPGPGNPTLSSGAMTQSNEDRLRVLTGGFFVQNLIGFRDRIFITTGVRVDGSSAFGSGFGLQAYPKVSASYVVHEEPFWNDSWGELKLRAAFGTAGRAPGAFDAIKTWNPAGWGSVPAYLPSNVGNSELGPERSVETEVGFDSSVLDGRVSTQFTYYNSKTKDALFNVQSVPSTGFQSSQLKNVGEIQNSGIELGIEWRLIQGQRLSWTLGTNLATNHSKVLSLGEAIPFSLGNQGWIIEGEPIMVIRGVKLLNPDEIADPQVELDHIFGPNSPTRIIGLSSTLELPAQITLTARGEYQGGHYMSDGATQDGAGRNIRSWPTCLASNALQDAGRGNERTAYDRLRCDSRFYRSQAYINKADFFKLRDVTARFPIPFGVPNATSAFVTLSASNWLRWVNDDFPIFDPETGSGAPTRVRSTGTGVTPPPATFTGSLRLTF